MEGGPSDPVAGGEPRPYSAAEPELQPQSQHPSAEATVVSDPEPEAAVKQPAEKRMNPLLELVLIFAAALGLWYVANG